MIVSGCDPNGSLALPYFWRRPACTRAATRTQFVGMTARPSSHILGAFTTLGMLPGATCNLSFYRRVNALLADHDDLIPIVQPMLIAWRQPREQITAFDKAMHAVAN
jgi:transposase